MKRTSGFTLVELLVVIGILGMLFVVLLNTIASGQASGEEFACRANLKSLYEAMIDHKSSKQRLPSGGGTKFLWNLWRWLGPTERHRDMFYCPEVARNADTHAEQNEIPLNELWRTADEFTSDSTDYAARAAKYRKNMNKGTEAIIADDNEGGSNHQRGTINVLFGDGRVKGLFKDDLIKDGLWPEDDPPDFEFVVGEGSPLPFLQKLTRN